MTKKSKKRDTVTYDLKDGNKIVYRGKTNNPEQRAAQHEADGKNFSHMFITSRRMTDEGAQKKEADALKTYRDGHGGNNPKYNETDDG